MEIELNQKNDTIKKLNQKTEELTCEKTRFFIQATRNQEIALMQKEDYDSLKNENNRQTKAIQQLENKLKEIKKKMGYNIELLSNLKEDEFEGDNNLLRQVSNFMTTQFVKNMKKKDDESSKGLKEKEREFSDEFNLSKFQYYKPGFFTFIKNDIAKNDLFHNLNNLKKNTEFKISPMFLSTMRAILDSKYNEFMLNEDYKQISKFPEFVYSWLSKYCIFLKI